ncbi:low temperature requirement protein A [Streptomyces longisporoflavus]|uniref:Low temperature requirement protein A n=1 Tax=Streptomyces longisporoflavus TaxID=28044 RepID=A0ABW7QYL8_9ACTN
MASAPTPEPTPTPEPARASERTPASESASGPPPAPPAPTAPAAPAALRPLRERGRSEAHRAATPLELFFDLCFVVAVAQAGVELVHAVAEGHAGEGVPTHGRLKSNRQSFLWGYGHYFVLGAAAAIGAGIEVAVEEAVGKAHISTLAASAAVTIPMALYLLTVWLLHSRYFKVGLAQQPVLVAGLVATPAVATGVTLTARTARQEATP